MKKAKNKPKSAVKKRTKAVARKAKNRVSMRQDSSELTDSTPVIHEQIKPDSCSVPMNGVIGGLSNNNY